MIDVRTLRIGSHVLVDGKRVRVCGITKRKIGYHHPEWRKEAHLCYARLNEVEPIAITPELLTGLGFEWREDSGCWCKYQNYDGEHYDWGLYVSGKEDIGWQFSLFLPFEDWRRIPKFYARYLHEIEGQLAYYGVELLKDK